jgi:5-methylcytosine-specific restriction protein A
MPNINNIKPTWIIHKDKKSTEGWTSTGNKQYHTAQWRRLRVIVLNRDPICKMCDDRASSVADHIIPVRLGGSMWDLSNLQGVCDTCHNSKSGKEGKNNK